MKFGSPIAQAAQPFIRGQYDTLLSEPLPIPFVQNYIFSLTAQNNYKALAIVVSGLAGANALAASASTIIQTPTFSSAMRGLSGFNQCVLPIFCNAGDGLTVRVFLDAVPTGGGIEIYGLTDTQPPLFGPDGRCYPIGTHLAESSLVAAAGPLIVIGAPGNSLRILLKYLSIYTTTAGQAIAAKGTIGGNNLNFFLCAGVGSLVYPIPDSGFLMDVNTELDIIGTAAVSGSLAAIYDLVPA